MSSTHPYAAYYLPSALENKEASVSPHTIQHHPLSRPRNTISPPALPQIPSRRHHLILFFAYCVFPPVLSLLDLAIGHVVLRYPLPILSSVQAGASGGAILSLPVGLLLYLLFAPNQRPDATTASPEDFFEDDDYSLLGRSTVEKYGPCAFLALLVLLIGTISGPLGTTVLSNSQSSQTLTHSQAAIAGIVGSAALLGFFLFLLAIGFLLWVGWRQRRAPAWIIHR